jgi:hypothetical protein
MYSSTDIATTVRQATTANFLIDSRDRVGFTDSSYTGSQNAGDFLITKPNNLLNGFFTRIIPNEVRLDWCIDNINSYWGNDTIQIVPSNFATSTISVTLPSGEYTVAQTLNYITSNFNANPIASSRSLTLSTITTGNNNSDGTVSLGMYTSSNQTPMLFLQSTITGSNLDLPTQLNIATNGYASTFTVDCPAILPTSYVDFVSPNLTQNQDLKDGSTAMITNDIIYRWYLAWDTPEPLDSLGYPIYQGYKRFIQRRPIAFPKQIKWDNNIPIGQLAFQVLDDNGKILSPDIVQGEMEWQMTCLVSEN